MYVLSKYSRWRHLDITCSEDKVVPRNEVHNSTSQTEILSEQNAMLSFTHTG